MWLYFSVGILSGFALKNAQESVCGSYLIKKNPKQQKKIRIKEGIESQVQGFGTILKR